jgi:hypothetical protein
MTGPNVSVRISRLPIDASGFIPIPVPSHLSGCAVFILECSDFLDMTLRSVVDDATSEKAIPAGRQEMWEFKGNRPLAGQVLGYVKTVTGVSDLVITGLV